MKTQNRFTNIFLLCASFALITAACKKKNDINWYRPIGTPLAAYVKYVNALPGATLDFYGYYTKLIAGVGYTKDPAYTNSPFGNIVVYATNYNQTSNRIAVSTSANTPQMNGQGLWADKYQTMIACKATDSTTAETMILLRDDLTAPAAGLAHIRFVNLAQRGTTKVKTVDFTATAGPGTPGVIFGGLSYQVPSNAVRIDPAKGLATPNLGVYTSGPFSPVQAGTYDFEVKETDGSQSVVVKTGVELKAGKIYTLYTSGTIGGTILPTLNMLEHTPNQ